VLQIGAVDIGDFQLAARGGFEIGGNIHYRIVVKIKAGDGIIRSGLCRFFLERNGAPTVVELHHSITLRVAHMIGKDRCALTSPGSTLQLPVERMPVENVVAQYQRGGMVANKLAPDDKSLR